MNKETQKYHLDTVALFQSKMYETLLYPHHLITDTIKEFTLVDEGGAEWIAKGYLAVKSNGHNRVKYLVQEQFMKYLPIRINETEEFYLIEGKKTKSVIEVIQEPTPFKIEPKQMFIDQHVFIDDLAPFKHSMPDYWTLNKFVAVSALIGKTFTGVSSEPEFGKSSIYELLNGITKKCPVFQPRSIPGIMAQITQDGNMVFDEVHKSNKEVKQCMENFTLQVAAGKPNYINGALQAKNTKSRYDVSGQSITYLYNTYQNYSNPKENFFDYIFDNNDAIDSRLLKLRFKGILTEQFDRNFDMIGCVEENTQLYVNIAKHLLWLKQYKQSNSYTRRYKTMQSIQLKGRKKIIFDEISWLIDFYSASQQEYNKFISLFEQSIKDYQEMVGKEIKSNGSVVLSGEVFVAEERVKSDFKWDDKCQVWLLCSVCGASPCNRGSDNELYCKEHLK